MEADEWHQQQLEQQEFEEQMADLAEQQEQTA